ncbi:MAG TPA: sugar ABC transporter permease [Acidimicrobiales bacterium]|nr:sugar ABC transporter permease [Acidimicrobiales bacterium]
MDGLAPSSPVTSVSSQTDAGTSLLAIDRVAGPRGPESRSGAPVPAFRQTGRLRSFVDRRFYTLATIPALVVVTAVVAVPLAIGIYLSFTNYGPTTPSFDWAGLVNYKNIVDNGQIHVVINNTLIYAGTGIVIQVALGLVLALLLARPIRRISFFRVIYMVPLVVPGVASAVAWSVLFNTGSGWINYFLGLVHLPQPNWTGNAHTAMPTILIASSWGGVPIIAIILLAGLLSLPKEPVEAARIDGASAWRVLLHITLPGLRPVIAFAALFQIVNLFREFALFDIVTGGGPGLATNVINYYVYQQTFQFGSLGLGAAMAVLLVVMMAIPLVVIFKLSGRGK